MKNKFITVIALAFGAVCVQAEWVLVTDFDEEGGLDPTVVGKGPGLPAEPAIPPTIDAVPDPAPWPGDAGNKVLHVDHNNPEENGMDTAYLLLPEGQTIVDGTTATLYWRWWMDKNGGHETAIAGTNTFTDLAAGEQAKNGYGDHQTWWRLAGEFSPADFGGSSPNIEGYWPADLLGAEGSGWSLTAKGENGLVYEPGEWLEVWYILNTDGSNTDLAKADTRQEYWRQGGDQIQNKWYVLNQDGVQQKEIDYLPQQKGPIVHDYEGFYMVNWNRGGAPDTGAQVYMDDFWVDISGVNLTTPPHGKITSSAGVDVKFVNLATRGLVGENAGEELIAGFVLLGDNPQQVLIRGLGPDLTDRGVNGVLANPTIEVRNFAGEVVASNDDWGNATDNADVAAAIAAASGDPAAGLADGSADAAILVTLPQNDVYTVVVSSAVAGETGVALVEVFEMDPLTGAQ